MDANQILDLVAGHKWVPLAALVIGLIVRLLKSDTKIPIDVPPRYRVWLALALGALSGVLEQVATGIGWQRALVGGAVSAAMAVLGQNVVVDSLRGGREFALPGLIKPNTPPSPGKPPSIPPGPKGDDAPSTGPAAVILLAAAAAYGGATTISACTAGQVLNVADLLADKIKCAVLNQDLPDVEIVKKCAIQPGDVERILAIVGESRKSAAAKASTRVDAGVCAPADGGAQ